MRTLVLSLFDVLVFGHSSDTFLTLTLFSTFFIAKTPERPQDSTQLLPAQKNFLCTKPSITYILIDFYQII
ncbi:hypothetical protein DFS34DRAFT_610986 [Phlyctochytrium arcticum]|nr:hypothetical protein DFS34DRAFT_610986 [Phlyctochytrium arcticum]